MILIVDTEKQVVVVKGVPIHMDLLANLAEPDPDVFYRLIRVHDEVSCERLTRSQIVEGA